MHYTVVIDVMTFASYLVTIMVALWGFHKWDIARRERRAEFLWKILKTLRESEEIQSAEYKIDYDRQEGISEGQKDRLLSYMAYICYLRKKSVISDEEFVFFEYEITRILCNDKIRTYLDFIKEFAKSNGCRNPFVALNDYAAKGKRP